jgi:hypothetical protein
LEHWNWIERSIWSSLFSVGAQNAHNFQFCTEAMPKFPGVKSLAKSKWKSINHVDQSAATTNYDR